MDTFLDPLCADDFAILLGLKARAVQDRRGARNEVDRLYLLQLYHQRSSLESATQQGMIWAKFCALYLPATVDRFLDLPVPMNESIEMVEELQLNNAYLEMLSAVQNTPYFSKYLRSQSLIAAGGKRLPQVVGQRLVALGPTWDGHLLNPPPNRVPEYFALLTASVLRLFCNLLAAFIKEEDQTQVISSRTSGQLRPMLRSWALRYPNTCLGDVSMRALGVLGGSPEYLRGVNRFIRRDVKNWKECAMPKCKVSVDLKACGKCQTVRYCSSEHQRAHWNIPFCPHKQMCHRTNY